MRALFTFLFFTATLLSPIYSQVVLDSMVDSRDGISYKTIRVGQQTWMAENLRFSGMPESYYYDNMTNMAAQYGLLYSWKTAMEVCPTGWHLPTDQDWEVLALTVASLSGQGNYRKVLVGSGGVYDNEWMLLAQAMTSEHSNSQETSFAWEGVGKALKKADGWVNHGHGTDDIRFSALPAGYRFARGLFYNLHFTAYFWTADSTKNGEGIYRSIHGNSSFLYRNSDMKVRGFSVRCVK